MSYSGYNQFSPYYQPPQQTTQQNNGSSNSGGVYSSDSSFQPLSAYQSDQQRQQRQQQQQQQQQQHHQTHNQSSHQSNSNYDSHDSHGYGNNSVTTSAQAALSYGHQNYGAVASSSGRSNEPPNTYASNRPDTTALGNLAYASSLGPDQQQQQQQQQQSSLSLSQLIDYNRSRSGYGTSGGYAGTSDINHSHQRVDAQSSNQQSTNGLPHTTAYQTSNTLPAYSSQSYGLNNPGRSSPAQHQYSNPSHHAHVNQASYRQNNHTPQPPRPASRPAMPRPNPQAGARSNHSPQVSTAQVTQSSSAQIGGNHQHGSKPSTTGGQQARNNPSPAHPQPAHASPASSHHQPRSSAIPATQSNQSRKLSNTASGNSGLSAPPVTVDPNQIFNHSEWERRQEEEKAERLARAAAAATQIPGDDVTQAAKALVGQSASATSESTTKEQIELEMKQMIEKMRDYKAKDPSLFSQVWEEVKKGDAAQRTPQPASTGAKASAVNGLPTPTIELPAESDLTATPSASDLDRGRYPMQRRKRGGSTYTPDRPHKSDKKKAPAEPPTGNHAEAIRDQTDSTSPPPPPPQQQAPTKAKETPKPSTGKKATTQVAGASLPPAGTTYWPESKKRGLAIAARNALLYPAINHGKNISADEIHALLDRNPSYAQLCEYLEGKGFVIERGPFARTLLAAVPEMGAQKHARISTPNQSSPKPAPPTSGNISGQPKTQTAAPPPPPPMAQTHTPPYYAPPFKPALHFSSFQAPSGQPQNGSPGAHAGFNPNVKPEDAPSQPLKPMSKEEKAKKRTFADIVDLSQLSDEDDYAQRRPKPRTEKPASTMATARPAVTGITNEALNARWRPPGAPTTQLQSPPSVQQPAPPKPMPRPIPRQMPHLNIREHLLYDLVVDPMNKRRDALRRSSYDPKTIARDILLASGKHPSMPPLNQHLEALRDKFVSVDANSDLSTFRWDLVDPGGDPAPKASARPVEENEASLFLSDPEPTSPTSPTLQASRPAVVAVSVGGRSDSPAQSTSQGSLKGKYGRRGRPPKKRFNISGLGIGEANPSAALEVFPATPGGDLTTQGPAKKASLPDTTPYADTTTDANTSFEPAITPSSPRPAASPAVSAATPSTIGLPKRKGRPPRAKNHAPRSDKGIPKKVSQEFISTPARKTTPSQIRLDSSSKPMRPSGLRNTLTPSKSGIAVIIPSPARSLESTSPALRPKPVARGDSSIGTDPSYPVYRCQWENCPAELHNLEILRKHVRKQHRDRISQVGPWQCKWGDCMEKEGVSSPFIYTDPEKWERHMEKKHLGPYEKEVGGRGGKGRADMDSSGHNALFLSQSSSSPDGATEPSRHGLPSEAMRRVFNGSNDGEDDDVREVAGG